MQHVGLIQAPTRLPLGVVILAALGIFAGCTPKHYRLDADRETYAILAKKSQQPEWATPPFSVVPSSASRNFDPSDPDRPPLPPDDPAAHEYMHMADGKHGYKHWHKDGDALTIESPAWLRCLQLSDDGQLQLNRQRAVELGILNSRDYQTELEQLYLVSLALTLERFEFAVQWFGFTETFFRHFGTSSVDDPSTGIVDGNESNTLRTSSTLGLTRAFPAGGQLLGGLRQHLHVGVRRPQLEFGFFELVLSLLATLATQGGTRGTHGGSDAGRATTCCTRFVISPDFGNAFTSIWSRETAATSRCCCNCNRFVTWNRTSSASSRT